MVTAYIAFGSNMGDREKNIQRAMEYLKELGGIAVKRSSAIYETEPEGGPAQDKFLNGVVEIETSLLPDELLERLKGIESRLGRVKTVENGPRPIDLDIIFYQDIVIDGERIKIPHPRIQEREFVLRGLNEIAPDFVHPRLNKTVRELYGALMSGNENNKIDKVDAGIQPLPEASG
ncbi:MAG: 2-amino-4-hydroxy-6-hydroxymethyldihydropteridine diphosphokinase [Candidatus Omnitrophica bacterium]|nr:2-amino-4-hydroxy-6-hydroxymethyldihydropteridine diphosphokinase [Candidatus Omnitrophota bacterium]